MIISSIVKKGTIKDNCDDTVLINNHLINDECMKIEDEPFSCVFVADGVGGNKGGKDASQYLLNHIEPSELEGKDENGVFQYFGNLNLELIEYASHLGEKFNMATTLTGLIKVDKKYFLVHIGNTRMFVKQGSFLKQVTVDQTQYQQLINMGQYEAAKRTNKSAILGCFGGGNAKYFSTLEVAQIFEEELPEIIILTSDGIHDFIDIDRIEDWMNGYQSLDDFNTIIEQANELGSTDDKSVIYIQNV